MEISFLYYDTGETRRWADLNDLWPANEILDILGCDGSLHLHLPNTQFHWLCLAGSRTVDFLRGDTKWAIEAKTDDVGEYGYADRS